MPYLGQDGKQVVGPYLQRRDGDAHLLAPDSAAPAGDSAGGLDPDAGVGDRHVADLLRPRCLRLSVTADQSAQVLGQRVRPTPRLSMRNMVPFIHHASSAKQAVIRPNKIDSPPAASLSSVVQAGLG